MQTLPYVVVTNPHISQVYELYYKAFETLRRVKEIKTLEDNERFCTKISQTLQEHLAVIPKLAMGVLECRDLMRSEDMDRFMNTLLRSVSIAGLNTEAILTILIDLTANISAGDRRTTPCIDRDIQFAVALPRCEKSLRDGICW